MAILLSYRLRILAATMATFSLGTRAHAIPTELNFFTPTAFPQNNTNVFQFFNLPTDLTLDIAVYFTLGFDCFGDTCERVSASSEITLSV